MACISGRSFLWLAAYWRCCAGAAPLPCLSAGAGAGICMYAYLLRAAPVRVCFRCCWLDSAGVHHIEGDDPAGRIAHYGWSEIERAEASDEGDDFRGIILFLRRAGMRHVPVLLTLEENASAVAAIREWIGAPPQTGSKQHLKQGTEER